MKPTPCPIEHLGFRRSIKVGDETHVQTCLKMVPEVEHLPNGTVTTIYPVGQEWTTVGIVYERPAPQAPPPQRDRLGDFVFVAVLVFAFVVLMGARR